jgi:hypothetical protein
MNFQILAQIILAFSFLGLAAIIARKIPALVALEVPESPKEGHLSKLKKKIQEANPLKGTKPEIFLQKILSKVRVLSLKADNKATDLIQILHKRVEKKGNFSKIFPEKKEQTKEKSPNGSQNPISEKNNSDNYWQEIKTSVSAAAKRKSPAKKPKKK